MTCCTATQMKPDCLCPDSYWPIFILNGRQFVFATDDPNEERIICLDELPCDEIGQIVLNVQTVER